MPPAHSEPPASPIRREEEEYLRVVNHRVPERLAEIGRALAGSEEDAYLSGEVRRLKQRGLRREQELLDGIGEKAPYFGRFSIQEITGNTLNPEEVFYVGLPPIRGYNNDNLVWDYREDLCALYFRCGKPEIVSYRAPGGMYRVSFFGKRQISIAHKRLVSVHDGEGNRLDAADDGHAAVPLDPLLQIGDAQPAWIDPVLTDLLAEKRASGHMAPIVATIQAEQDYLIRSTADVLVIQGPAGSGKTIVALQRVAQLLFDRRKGRRDTLRSRGLFDSDFLVNNGTMVVYSPNAVFSDYISRVLPDLHEDAIQQVIFEEDLRRILKRRLSMRPRTTARVSWRIEARRDRYEALLAGQLADADTRVAAFKASYAMLPLLRGYADKVIGRIETAALAADIPFAGYHSGDINTTEGVFFGREAMATYYRAEIARGKSPAEALDRVLYEITDRQSTFLNQQHTSESTIRKLSAVVDEFKQNARAAAMDALRSIAEIYRGFWADCFGISAPGGIEQDAARLTLSSLDDARIRCDDIVPMLLLDGLLNGFAGRLRDIDHLVIDEAQDYSVLHFEYLSHILPTDCGLTIVGDVSQGIDAGLSLKGWEQLKDVFGSRLTRNNLTHSYRSCTEITNLANAILEHRVRIESVRSSGVLPVLLQLPADAGAPAVMQVIAQNCRALAEKGRGYVAVLCRTRIEARDIARGLQKQGIAVGVLADITEPLPTDAHVVVAPLYLAKGLEFDAVIVAGVDASAYSSPVDRLVLYTACTRPLHELILISVGTPSAILTDAAAAETLFDVIQIEAAAAKGKAGPK